MALTVEQAQRAGEIAAKIAAVQAAKDAAQAAVDGGVQLATVSASGALSSVSGITGATGVNLSASVPLNSQESATVLNALIGVYGGKLDALNADLAAVTEVAAPAEEPAPQDPPPEGGEGA